MANLSQLAPDLSAQTPAAADSGKRSAREQLGLAMLAMHRARRGALARIRRSRLMLWRYRWLAPGGFFPPPTEGFDLIMGMVLSIYCFAHFRLQSLVAVGLPEHESQLRAM